MNVYRQRGNEGYHLLNNYHSFTLVYTREVTLTAILKHEIRKAC